MEFIKNFIELTRAYALSVTFSSCMIIFAYAFYNENFSLLNFFLLLLAICCVHLGANLFDDYIDVKLKLNDSPSLNEIVFKSFTPKARLITNGTFSFRQIEQILAALFSVAIAIGIYFAIITGWQVLLFGLIGGLLVLFYPVSSKYCLSEITIGLIYGPLLINGGYFALTGSFNPDLNILSLAIFFTCLVLLHTHNLMDWEYDIEEGKKTLCILSENKQSALNILKIMVITPYLIVFAGVLALRFNPKILYVFLTLPIATKLLESMKDYINIKDVKFEPRWYWGIFENWDEIKAQKIEFFMFRFYLARNYGLFFALFAAIGAMA